MNKKGDKKMAKVLQKDYPELKKELKTITRQKSKLKTSEDGKAVILNPSNEDHQNWYEDDEDYDI